MKYALSAAGRLLFCLIKKVVKKIKFAVTTNNECFALGRFETRVCTQTLKQQTDLKKDSIHLRYSDESCSGCRTLWRRFGGF